MVFGNVMKVSESRLQLLPEFPKPSVQTKSEMKKEGERSKTSPKKKESAPIEDASQQLCQLARFQYNYVPVNIPLKQEGDCAFQ